MLCMLVYMIYMTIAAYWGKKFQHNPNETFHKKPCSTGTTTARRIEVAT